MLSARKRPIGAATAPAAATSAAARVGDRILDHVCVLAFIRVPPPEGRPVIRPFDDVLVGDDGCDLLRTLRLHHASRGRSVRMLRPEGTDINSAATGNEEKLRLRSYRWCDRSSLRTDTKLRRSARTTAIEYAR